MATAPRSFRVRATPSPREIKSRDDVELALLKIADTLSRIQKIEIEAAEKARKREEQMHARTLRLRMRALTWARLIKSYADAHRGELTENEARKSETFDHGTLKWRGATSVVLTKSDREVIASLKKLGLRKHFIRTTEEVDREALLKSENRALVSKIPEVKIETRELFYIEPDLIRERFKYDPRRGANPWAVEQREEKKRM